MIKTLIASSWFPTVLPWALFGVTAAILGMTIWIASLYADIDSEKMKVSAMKLAAVEHARIDDQAAAMARADREEDENKDREARKKLEDGFKEQLNELSKRAITLADRLGPNGDLRVRLAICETETRSASDEGVPGTSAAASRVDQQSSSGADIIRDAIGKAELKDLHYKQLLDNAILDRATCGVRH